MSALIRCSAAALALLLTTAYIAASNESGLSAFRLTLVEPAAAGQAVMVNRANKADRESRVSKPATAQSKPASVAKGQKILEGCDPAFSPLTSSSKHNFAGRCLS